MKIRIAKIDSLYPDPGNARAHNERNLDSITLSLQRFGQQKPIVVQPDGRIVAGNGLYFAAKSLGWARVDVVETTLGADEAKAYGIADNRLGELSDWDTDALLRSIRELEDSGLVELLGFDDPELAELFDEALPTAPPQDSRRTMIRKDVPTVRIVLAVPQVEIVESALQLTGQMNRALALTTICEDYAKRQLDAIA